MKKFTKEISAMLAALTATGSVAGYADAGKVCFAVENGYEVTTCETSEIYPLGGVTVTTTSGTYLFTEGEEYPDAGVSVTDAPEETLLPIGTVVVTSRELYSDTDIDTSEITTVTTTEEYPILGNMLPEEHLPQVTTVPEEEYPTAGVPVVSSTPEEEYPTAGVPVVSSTPDEQITELQTTPYEEYPMLGDIMPPCGDLNYDYVVDLTDLSTLSLILLGEVDDYSEYLADFNQDGCIDLRDLAGMKVEIVRYNG